jgi:hypothetical protein
MLDYTMALMANEGAGYVLSTSKALDTELLRTQVSLAKTNLSRIPTILLKRKQAVFVLEHFGAPSL